MQDVGKIKIGLMRLKPGDKVLDMGGSSGIQGSMIARQGLELHGVDHSQNLSALFQADVFQNHLNCHPIVADARQLPYADNSFHAVVSTEVFEHVPEPNAVAREAFRVLQPGGMACISVPTEFSESLFRRIHPNWVEDSQHINVFHIGVQPNTFEMPCLLNLRALLEQAGFRIIRIEKENFEWSVFWIFHSLVGSRFDFTGTPTEHQWLSNLIFRGWRLLDMLKVGTALKWLGNHILPKSIYIYAEKASGNVTGQELRL